MRRTQLVHRRDQPQLTLGQHRPVALRRARGKPVAHPDLVAERLRRLQARERQRLAHPVAGDAVGDRRRRRSIRERPLAARRVKRALRASEPEGQPAAVDGHTGRRTGLICRQLEAECVRFVDERITRRGARNERVVDRTAVGKTTVRFAPRCWYVRECADHKDGSGVASAGTPDGNGAVAELEAEASPSPKTVNVHAAASAAAPAVRSMLDARTRSSRAARAARTP